MWPRPGGFFTSASPSPAPQLGGVPGFRDLLPLEAEILREAQESLLGEMRRWGYRHVITPPVERMDVVDVRLGIERQPPLPDRRRPRGVLPGDHGCSQAA